MCEYHQLNTPMPSPYLHIVDTSKPCEVADGYPTDPAKTYDYPLDNFQRWAIAAISRHENVLVTAKTGSGKTLVGEYQIAESLRAGRRVFYTTPIKSLSNQKFHDLRAAFPEASVGIMTGDIKFMPHADIVIMTTEILRNLLYKQGTATAHLGLTASLSIDRLDAVVFDECHYINNKERGKVWEETMILLPPEVSLILLSATIDRPDLFANWIAELRGKPMWLIPTSHRVVPLTHYVLFPQDLDEYLESKGEKGHPMRTIMDAGEKFKDTTYRDWLKARTGLAEAAKAFKARAAAKDTPGGLEGKVRVAAFQHTLNQTVEYLARRELLPALFFVFSRKDCERYAAAVEGARIDSSDAAAVKHIIDYHLRAHKETLQNVKQYWDIRALCERGIAYHHSGLLPVLKEMVEILFSKGYIKCLFCTETFAVGINMPTKTAVFLDLKKYCEERGGLRVLHTDEYLQMAGRAGRRGLDKVGTVLYLPVREPITVEEAKLMMKGGMPQISSRMEFGYEFILKAFHTGNDTWRRVIGDSYWNQQQAGLERQLEDERAAIQGRIDGLGLTAERIVELAVRFDLESKVRGTVNAARKEAQRALDHWKNRHMGAVWENAYTAMGQYNKLVADRTTVERQLAELRAVRTDPAELLKVRLDYLIGRGFLAGDVAAPTLTPKGQMATEVNEGHPLVLVEAYERGVFSGLTGDEIVCVLGCFMAERQAMEGEEMTFADLTVGDAVKRACAGVVEVSEYLWEAEVASSGADYWAVGAQWVEVAARWLADEPAAHICADFGLYEGNLIRGILKLSNLVEEFVSLATFKGDVAALEALTGATARLVRDVAVPDSLYLRL